MVPSPPPFAVFGFPSVREAKNSRCLFFGASSSNAVPFSSPAKALQVPANFCFFYESCLFFLRAAGAEGVFFWMKSLDRGFFLFDVFFSGDEVSFFLVEARSPGRRRGKGFFFFFFPRFFPFSSFRRSGHEEDPAFFSPGFLPFPWLTGPPFFPLFFVSLPPFITNDPLFFPRRAHPPFLSRPFSRKVGGI